VPNYLRYISGKGWAAAGPIAGNHSAIACAGVYLNNDRRGRKLVQIIEDSTGRNGSAERQTNCSAAARADTIASRHCTVTGAGSNLVYRRRCLRAGLVW